MFLDALWELLCDSNQSYSVMSRLLTSFNLVIGAYFIQKNLL